MQGFIVFNYAENFQMLCETFSGLVSRRQPHTPETIVDGFDNIPKGFCH
jgi:NADPH-dependent curcumin reductase CurA